MSFKLKTNNEVFGHHHSSKFGKPVILKDDLDPGIEAEANRDGTIFVKSDMSEKEIEKAVNHEDVHLEQMAQGRLQYDNDSVTWKKDTQSPTKIFTREGMNEGDPDFEWEDEAYSKEKEMSKSPLKQTRHDLMSQDSNLQNLSDSEKKAYKSGVKKAGKVALGVAATFAPVPFGKGKVAKWLGGALARTFKTFGNAPKQYFKLAGGRGYTTHKKAAEAVNKNRQFKVPVVGQPGKTAMTKDPNTKSISYANPRISMTKAERKAAGY